MYYVYILSNWCDSVMYIGVTGDLPGRLYEHRNGLADGFTKRYNVHKLVYFEQTNDVRSAIEREKQRKGWTRAKKELVNHQSKSKLERSIGRLGVIRSAKILRLRFAPLRMTYVFRSFNYEKDFGYHHRKDAAGIC